MARQTRKEKQAQTRECLMHSAANVFARRGLQQASIDEVAEDAGYTKGAFYANFKNKEELFLAMLDERFSTRIEHIEEVIADEDSPTEKARHGGDLFVEQMRADEDWERLFFEFSAYALRDENFREELVTRYRAMQHGIASALHAHGEQTGKDEAMDPDQVARIICIMGNGFALEKLLEGDAIPDELYGTMLMVFFAGLEALKAAGPQSAPALEHAGAGT
jgi:AcrR family transcriptional regulator